jgi:hypothetical protein
LAPCVPEKTNISLGASFFLHFQLPFNIENEQPPSPTMATEDSVASIPAYRDMVDELLDFAATLKSEQAIEPPLPSSELSERIRLIWEGDSLPVKATKNAHYAAIETAFRDKFYDFIVRSSQTPFSRCNMLIYLGLDPYRPPVLHTSLESFGHSLDIFRQWYLCPTIYGPEKIADVATRAM